MPRGIGGGLRGSGDCIAEEEPGELFGPPERAGRPGASLGVSTGVSLGVSLGVSPGVSSGVSSGVLWGGWSGVGWGGSAGGWGWGLDGVSLGGSLCV